MTLTEDLSNGVPQGEGQGSTTGVGRACRAEKEVALLRGVGRTGLHRGGDIELGLGGGGAGAWQVMKREKA